MKHALLRLGPSTTLPSPYFPSLRFSPPSISFILFSSYLLSVLLSGLKSLFILETSHIPHHGCSVTFASPCGCVFTPPSTLFPLHASWISSVAPYTIYSFTQPVFRRYAWSSWFVFWFFDWQADTQSLKQLNSWSFQTTLQWCPLWVVIWQKRMLQQVKVMLSCLDLKLDSLEVCMPTLPGTSSYSSSLSPLKTIIKSISGIFYGITKIKKI